MIAIVYKTGFSIDGLQTMLLSDGEHLWEQTAALIRDLHALDWPWRFVWLAWLVPSSLQDAVYRMLARNRYRMFGKTEICLVPPKIGQQHSCTEENSNNGGYTLMR